MPDGPRFPAIDSTLRRFQSGVDFCPSVRRARGGIQQARVCLDMVVAWKGCGGGYFPPRKQRKQIIENETQKLRVRIQVVIKFIYSF